MVSSVTISKKETFVNLSPVKFNNLMCLINGKVETSKEYNDYLIKNDRLNIKNIMKSLNSKFIKKPPPKPIPTIKQTLESDFKCYPLKKRKIDKKEKALKKSLKIMYVVVDSKECKEYCKKYFNAYIVAFDKENFKHYKNHVKNISVIKKTQIAHW